MSLSIRRPGRFGAAALAALAVGVTILAGADTAGAQCTGQPASQPFAAWGDSAWYVLAPDGGFEQGASAWTLSGGAGVAPGNEPFQVAGDADASSLALPAGSAATSEPMCIDVAHPTIRFFARNAGDPSSQLGVSVRYRGLLGTRITLPLGVVSAGAEWAPTAPVPVLVNLLSLLQDGEAAFSFAPADDRGDWSIDDVYVDPYSKG